MASSAVLPGQTERYGFHPDAVPPSAVPAAPGDVATGEERRFFLDRFGRRFKVYRARPYQPGAEMSQPGWAPPAADIPVVPPDGQSPLQALPGGGGVEKAQPFVPGENRYAFSGTPDLSQYPKPPQDRVWTDGPLLRRTEPGLTPVPEGEWPTAARRLGTTAPPAGDKTASPAPPPVPWDKPAISREPVVRTPEPPAPAPGDVPAVPPPGPMATTPPPAPADPVAELPYGVPVKGKKGFVTLDEHPNLPEIDVRGIAPGTPVEFPDPRDPQQIIQFRVPKFE